jgi:hypothetical protein
MSLLEGTDRAPPKLIEVEDADKKKLTVENRPMSPGWQGINRFSASF